MAHANILSHCATFTVACARRRLERRKPFLIGFFSHLTVAERASACPPPISTPWRSTLRCRHPKRRHWPLAPHTPPHADWPHRLWRSLAVVAALLLGCGLIFWIAAQWPEQTPSFKLQVLQASVLTPLVVAMWRPRLRTAGLLLATLALGLCWLLLAKPTKPGPMPGNCLPSGPCWPCPGRSSLPKMACGRCGW